MKEIGKDKVYFSLINELMIIYRNDIVLKPLLNELI